MTQPNDNDADGIVLEAGGELFTVGRCRLVQDSAVFRDMFELAQGDSQATPDGTLERPIPTGDDAAIFRDFVWALRVRPGELTSFVQSGASLDKSLKLINIARLAHKYQDPQLAAWALQQLHDTLRSRILAKHGDVLKPLIATLVLFEDTDPNVDRIFTLIKERVQEHLKKQERGGQSLASSYRFIDLIDLVEACTASHCTSLLAVAYYALLADPVPPNWNDDRRISQCNRQQLFRGAYRLSEEWHRLQLRCPEFFRARLQASQYVARPAALLRKLRAVPGNPYKTGIGALIYPDDPYLSREDYVQLTKWKDEVDALILAFPGKLWSYFEDPCAASQ